ncbi:VOC family protein [Micromonospora zhanjiangensis]|uniref:VOC family protein n=1 Tax=Micromonospora zhanjiangensis TaxID=1522057 RepID=A0ABV8KX83_9ACTN
MVSVTRLDHVVIAVSDWQVAIGFYRDVVGADVIGVAGDRVAFRIGPDQLSVHGPGVELADDNVARIPVRPGNSDICFLWDGPIEEAVRHLREHHVEVETGPVRRFGAGGAGTSVYFRDPDGSLIEFISYSASARQVDPGPAGVDSPADGQGA